jgi:hypothetical protein
MSRPHGVGAPVNVVPRHLALPSVVATRLMCVASVGGGCDSPPQWLVLACSCPCGCCRCLSTACEALVGCAGMRRPSVANAMALSLPVTLVRGTLALVSRWPCSGPLVLSIFTLRAAAQVTHQAGSWGRCDTCMLCLPRAVGSSTATSRAAAQCLQRLRGPAAHSVLHSVETMVAAAVGGGNTAVGPASALVGTSTSSSTVTSTSRDCLLNREGPCQPTAHCGASSSVGGLSVNSWCPAGLHTALLQQRS